MAVVPYLQHGDSISHDRWHTLFQEFDRKLDAAMDGKSLCFYWSESAGLKSSPWLGKKFFFFDVTQSFFAKQIFAGSPELVQYNHTPFVNAAAAATVATSPIPVFDAARKVVRVNYPAQSFYASAGRRYTTPQGGKYAHPSLFCHSLQAHTKLYSATPTVPTTLQPYYMLLGANGQTENYGVLQLEYISRFFNVELIFETAVDATFDFPAIYDKYNFFRIHNLGQGEMTVNFRKTDGSIGTSVTVANRGSRCVRRDSVDGYYHIGFKHFHKIKEGDGRAFDGIDATMTAQTEEIPPYSYVSNNVFNPQIIHQITVALQGDNAPKFVIDPSLFWDASDYYCPTYFSNVADSTLIGDLLHHKGELMVASTPNAKNTQRGYISFDGYGTMVSKFAAAGVSASVNGGGNYVLTKTGANNDLLTISTNILGGSGATMPTTLNQIFDASGVICRSPIAPTTKVFSDQLVNYNFEVPRLSETGDGFSTVNFHLTTLLDLKSFSQGDTAVSVFSGKQIKLTGFGPVMTWRRSIPVTAPPIDLALPFNLSEGHILYSTDFRHATTWGVDNASIYQDSFLHFGGFGFPSWYSGSAAFTSPRYEQRFSNRGSTADTFFDQRNGFAYFINPDFDHVVLRKPTVDSAVRRVASKFRKQSIKLLSVFQKHNVFAWLSGYRNKSVISSLGYDFTKEVDSIPTATQNLLYWPQRTRILAGTPGDGALGANQGGGFAIYDRMPILIDHYNNFASQVNGIVKVVPLHISAMFDRTLIYDSTRILPKDCYRNFDDNALNTPITPTLNALGIPVFGASDLPSSFADYITRENRTLAGNGGAWTTQTWTNDDASINSDLQVVDAKLFKDAYLSSAQTGIDPQSFSALGTTWFSVSAVALAASTLGFKFLFSQVGYPAALNFYTISSIPGQGAPSSGPYYVSVRADTVNAVRFVDCPVPSVFARLIQDSVGEILIPPTAWDGNQKENCIWSLKWNESRLAPQMSINGSAMSFPQEFLKVNWTYTGFGNLTHGNFTGNVFSQTRFAFPIRENKYFIARLYGCHGTAFRTPSPSLLFPESGGGAPATVAASGVVQVDELPEGSNLLTATTDARELFFFIDNTISV